LGERQKAGPERLPAVGWVSVGAGVAAGAWMGGRRGQSGHRRWAEGGSLGTQLTGVPPFLFPLRTHNTISDVCLLCAFLS
jgi:hypothetical protein